MELLKFYVAKLLLFLKIIDLPMAIVKMLPKKDKQLIEDKMADLDNKTNSDEFALTGYKKRKIIVRYFIDQLINQLDYYWLNAIFDVLPNDSKEWLANAIVELIFFNLKKI